MKTLLSVLVAFFLLAPNSFAAFPKPTDQCSERAIAFVKALETVNSGAEVVKEAQFKVTSYLGEDKRDNITVQAFGLNGDDSDTYNEYTVVLRKFQNGKCYSMESITLVGEN